MARQKYLSDIVRAAGGKFPKLLFNPILSYIDGEGYIDLTGNGNNPTQADSDKRPTLSGRHIVLDGVDDFLDCGYDESLDLVSNMTALVWFRDYGDDGGWLAPFARYGTSGNDRSWQIRREDDGELAVSMSSNGSSTSKHYISNVDVRDGLWHFGGMTFDGGLGDTGDDATSEDKRLKIFIDSERPTLSSSSPDADVTTIFDVGSDESVQIGSREDGGTVFSRNIGEVMLFNQTLTQSEIQRIYLMTMVNYQ